MSKAEEIFGADFNEHDIRHDGYDYKGMTEALLFQGFKLHHVNRPYAPPRSEWDEYMMENYLLDEEELQSRDFNNVSWTQEIQNGIASPPAMGRVETIKRIFKQCCIS